MLEGGAGYSSAAGEQPKFCTFSALLNAEAGAHVLVKFASAEANPVAQRWRDLLLTEHLALQTLRDAAVRPSQRHCQPMLTAKCWTMPASGLSAPRRGAQHVGPPLPLEQAFVARARQDPCLA